MSECGELYSVEDVVVGGSGAVSKYLTDKISAFYAKHDVDCPSPKVDVTEDRITMVGSCHVWVAERWKVLTL